MKKHNLSTEDEESVEDILREHKISPEEFVDFKKSKSKVICFL